MDRMSKGSKKLFALLTLLASSMCGGNAMPHDGIITALSVFFSPNPGFTLTSDAGVVAQLYESVAALTNLFTPIVGTEVFLPFYALGNGVGDTLTGYASGAASITITSP